MVLTPLSILTPRARVLFQGDSITDGNRGRTSDPNHILGHGYAFLLAARYGAAFPQLAPDFMNRGISGNTVLDLEARWEEDTLALRPQVLSILIGVNDRGRVPVTQYADVYDRLLARARAANPELKLVLCEPFVLPVGGLADDYAAALADMRQRSDVVARLAAVYGAALAPFQRVFDEACALAPADYWIWDGVHPTYAGHQLMADAWEQAVQAYWPI